MVPRFFPGVGGQGRKIVWLSSRVALLKNYIFYTYGLREVIEIAAVGAKKWNSLRFFDYKLKIFSNFV